MNILPSFPLSFYFLLSLLTYLQACISPTSLRHNNFSIYIAPHTTHSSLSHHHHHHHYHHHFRSLLIASNTFQHLTIILTFPTLRILALDSRNVPCRTSHTRSRWFIQIIGCMSCKSSLSGNALLNSYFYKQSKVPRMTDWGYSYYWNWNWY